MPLPSIAIIVNITAAIHSEDTRDVTGFFLLHFHLSQRRAVWLKIGTVYRLLAALTRSIKKCKNVWKMQFGPRYISAISVLHEKWGFTWPLNLTIPTMSYLLHLPTLI